MAGGVAADIRGIYPKGDDSLHLIKFGPFTIVAGNAADHIVEVHELPFACVPVKARLTAQDLIETNAITINLQDDSSVPKQIVTDHNVAAITDGAGSNVSLTIADLVTVINAGALIECSYGSGSTDSGVDVTVNLWVRPAF